ncbi:transport protein Sec24-like protein [Tanacetum coccineum]|uniref:Transport protein Sec24-like protein n=1 Tax=Tanacetum coccineum TaxID=301880 RepID=A0ABQ5HWS2_9ASTR
MTTPRPNNNFPPNYNPNPNFIADNLQNLQLNRPPNTANGPRGPPPPFSARPGPTPPGVPPPQGTLPNRPPGVGPMSNGPPAFGPPRGVGVRPGSAPPQQTMSSFLGGGIGSESQMRGPPVPSFGAPPRGGMQPPMFNAPPPPPGSAYGTQPWQMQSRQNVPPPPIPGSGQPPRMYGMPPPLPNQQSMATISPAMGPSGNAVSGPSKIDPNQIPRPVPTPSVLLHETRQGNQANPPPPATTEFIVRDTGNCSPRYMRSTINQIPCTSDLLTTSGMQLALLVQPLALPHPEEEPIQIVDFGEGGPVRCSRCKGYINPFMKFVDQGRRFVCNFCGFTDETPRDYQCNLGPDGRRRDADERPELCRGTVEFVATREFLVREPMPAVFFFLIDVSMNALQTGATAGACSAISRVIDDLPEGPRTMVGIATFDSTIHFYNLKRALQQPLMLIVPDVEDVYTPLQTDVIVQLSECRDHLNFLLESIPSMFESNKTADSAFGAGMKAAFLAMKSTGGKLLVFQSGKLLPSVGIAALSAREAEGRSNTSAGEKEPHKLLQPVDKTMKTLAIEFAEYQVSVDVFITTQSYVDIASISVIPRTTGGQVYYYHPFSALSDPAKLYNDLRWNVTRPQGFEAVMRVRCSQGLQVQDYSGNFCKRIPTDVDLPAVDCDKSIMVTLKHDDKLADGTECSFQCALLYTTVYGQRRIRVSTLSLPCTSMLSNLFRSADLDTQFSCFLKQAANEIPITPSPQVRDRVTDLCISILHSYRKFCATVSSSGQLILPEALKLLPLYTLALIKSIGLRSDGRIDDRSYWINYVASLSVQLSIPLVYPRMISVHDIDSKDTDGSVIPPPIPLSSEHVSDDGIYLLENGEDCLIYVGGTVDPDKTQKLFGVSSFSEIPSQLVLQQYDNPLSKKLNEVINEIRSQRCNYLRLKLCKKGEPSGMTFFSYMVEDKSPNSPSYGWIHRTRKHGFQNGEYLLGDIYVLMEEYVDDQTLIPKCTSLVMCRFPRFPCKPIVLFQETADEEEDSKTHIADASVDESKFYITSTFLLIQFCYPSFMHGYAKYAEWSASLIEDETRRRLNATELQAKNTKLRLLMNYRPPTTNFEALIDDNFTVQKAEKKRQLQANSSKHQFVAGKYRLSEACYFLKTIKCIYSIGKSLCALGGINIHTTLDMAWDTGSLSHALCASPVDPLFMKTLLEHNIKSDGVQFWTDSRIGESQKVGFELCLSVCPTISLVNSHSDAHAIKAQKTIDVIKSAASMQGHKKLSMDACMHAAQNERLRLRVVVQVLFSDHVKISKAIASSTVKETGESHDKATKAVPASEQLSMHEIYIARAAKIYGLPETLEIYEHAISSEGLPEKDAMKICIKYAEFGKSHGETDHMLYEFNIMSTSLPDINHPNLVPKYQLQSILLSFDVPACPRSSRLKGLTVNFRYTISDDDWDALGEHHLTLEQEIVAFVLQAFFSRPKLPILISATFWILIHLAAHVYNNDSIACNDKQQPSSGKEIRNRCCIVQAHPNWQLQLEEQPATTPNHR